MAGALINLVAQLLAGWLGGTGAGRLFRRTFSLGPFGDGVAGVIGGLVGGQALQALIPGLGVGADTLDVTAMFGQVVSGGVGGAGLVLLVGLLRNLLDPTHRHA